MAESHHGDIRVRNEDKRPAPPESSLKSHRYDETSSSAYWGEQLKEIKDQVHNVMEDVKGKTGKTPGPNDRPSLLS